MYSLSEEYLSPLPVIQSECHRISLQLKGFKWRSLQGIQSMQTFDVIILKVQMPNLLQFWNVLQQAENGEIQSYSIEHLMSLTYNGNIANELRGVLTYLKRWDVI